ncbi:class I SAM-dependent methyltransferase [Candidatus Microgenomates bacterium]|nr:MAG: class I SAM-dependent methyltransferase [Candidatus Microgenomates bacterium]
MEKLTTNFSKHKSKNPIQKLLINNFYHNLIKLMETIKPESILDAGCGEGFTLNKLFEHKIGKKLEGIDGSEIAVSIGKKMFPNLTLKKGDIYKLPFNENSFDLVICTEVLEHLENPEKALNEIIRVSKKNIIVSVPNEPFFRLSNFLRGKNLKRFGNDPGHINNWGIFSFKKLIRGQNLKIKKIELPFPWIMLLLEK